MKRLLCVVGFVLMLCSHAVADVPINPVYFPDDGFREFVRDKYDKNNDGILSSYDEIRQVTDMTIDGNGRNIRSIDGIEHFTNLQNLNCNHTNITAIPESPPFKNTKASPSGILRTVNLSDNAALKKVSLTYNTNLTSVNVTGNTALISIVCENNQSLRTLDLSGNTALKTISCTRNKLTTLTLPTGTTSLTKLSCEYNKLTKINNLSVHTKLKELSCEYNHLGVLDVSSNTQLESLSFGSNQLKQLGDCTMNCVRYKRTGGLSYGTDEARKN